MGGMMGAMLGVRVFSQDPIAMLIFAYVIFIIVMALILKLIRQEVKGTDIKTLTSQKNNWNKTFLCMITLLLVVSVVFFKPISHYFRDLFGDTAQVSDDSSKKINEVQAEQKEDYQEAVIMVGRTIWIHTRECKSKSWNPCQTPFSKEFYRWMLIIPNYRRFPIRKKSR
ncbi:hypothetical protein ACQKMD_11610 [Viridibacillus sp. NPDC096237]|uniref:hypothetical protein n=1 Tax=Viridibacillus sp. NPDC096237 TaxID=3390721 RepID=UPI003D059775